MKKKILTFQKIQLLHTYIELLAKRLSSLRVAIRFVLPEVEMSKMQVWMGKACDGTCMCQHTPYMKHTCGMSHSMVCFLLPMFYSFSMLIIILFISALIKCSAILNFYLLFFFHIVTFIFLCTCYLLTILKPG